MNRLDELTKLCRDYRFNLCDERAFIIEFMSKFLALSTADRSTLAANIEELRKKDEANNV